MTTWPEERRVQTIQYKKTWWGERKSNSISNNTGHYSCLLVQSKHWRGHSQNCRRVIFVAFHPLNVFRPLVLKCSLWKHDDDQNKNHLRWWWETEWHGLLVSLSHGTCKLQREHLGWEYFLHQKWHTWERRWQRNLFLHQCLSLSLCSRIPFTSFSQKSWATRVHSLAFTYSLFFFDILLNRFSFFLCLKHPIQLNYYSFLLQMHSFKSFLLLIGSEFF